MNELVNYISHITHKILSAIIIGIADNSKLLSLSAIKNIGPIMQTLQHCIIYSVVGFALSVQYFL